MSAGEGARRWPVVDDADVVAACGGDPVAFARLYLALDDRLRGYIFHRSATIAGTELDTITAEVWLRGWQRRDRFTGVTATSFLAWIRAIAHNLVTDTARRAATEARRIDAVGRTLREADGDPSAHVDDRDAVGRVMRALPADARELLYLYYYEDVSRAELAELLDVTLSVLDRRLREARELFRDALARQAGDQND
jgi:RNA polymerase sigma-70 factor (ECF subfamily)